MNTTVKIAGIEFKNPITVASGTFASGMEYDKLCDIGRLGAITTKGVASKPWEGNPTPRVAETKSGMLNAIGLQNPGVDMFIKRDIPFLRGYDTKVIVNVCGHEESEYIEVVDRLYEEDVDMLEINVSCPNIKAGGITIGTDPHKVEALTGELKSHAKQPIIIKLSPNVTDISEIARAAEAGGADGVSLINTITGMRIDVDRRQFVLANRTGGMSGPCIHPVAVRMVYQVSKAVDIPIIGMGGVSDYRDALELIMAGATMVAVGTANFRQPDITMHIIDDIEEYMRRHEIRDINELIGCVN